MMQYKEAMRSHWRGYRLLHVGHDPHRNREARYYALPSEFGLIGYSDDTDSFVIPVSSFLPKAVTDALAKIRAGEDFRVEPEAPRRPRRPSLEDEEPIVWRKRSNRNVQAAV